MASSIVPGKIAIRFESDVTVGKVLALKDMLVANGVEIDSEPKDGVFILSVPIGTERDWVIALEGHFLIASVERYSEKFPLPTR